MHVRSQVLFNHGIGSLKAFLPHTICNRLSIAYIMYTIIHVILHVPQCPRQVGNNYSLALDITISALASSPGSPIRVSCAYIEKIEEPGDEAM